MRVLLVAAVLVAAGLSGCTNSEGSGLGASSTPRAPAPAPQVNESAGSISGRVVDEERLPVIGAQVVLKEKSGMFETDPAGNFTINDLEARVYTVHVTRLGYNPAARKVTVDVGSVSRVEFVLTMVAIATEGYTTSQPFTGFIELGHAWTDYYALWGPNTFCSKCVFHAFFEPKPLDIKFEAGWTKPIEAPVVSPEIYYLLRAGWSNATSQAAETGTVLTSGYWYANRPIPRQLENGDNTSAINALKTTKADKMQIRIGGSFNGVAYQQRVDMWFSLAWGAMFKDDFTAFPPPG